MDPIKKYYKLHMGLSVILSSSHEPYLRDQKFGVPGWWGLGGQKEQRA